MTAPGQTETAKTLRRLGVTMFLPVVVLASIGIHYLIGDRVTTRQRGVEAARDFLAATVRELQLTNILAPALSLTNGRLSGLSGGEFPEAVLLRRLHGGDLFPAPVPTTNAWQPFAPRPEERAAFREAEAAEFADDLDGAVQQYRKLADRPRAFEARYRLATLELRRTRHAGALDEIRRLIDDAPPGHRVRARGHWLILQQHLARPAFDPETLTDAVAEALREWVDHPTPETRLMLERLREPQTSKRNASLRPLVAEAFNRLERQDRSREISPQIPSLHHAGGWKREAYLAGTRDPWFVMRRKSYRHNHDLLVVWTKSQLARQLRKAMKHDRLKNVSRPAWLANVTAQLDGLSIWGMGWGSAVPKRLWPEDGFTAPSLMPIATNTVGGFHLVASVAPGALVAESNLRILWFALLIVTAAGVSVYAWRQTRSSLLQLAELNRQKSNFVSSVSHELRAPVAAMQLMAESLQAGKIRTGDKRREYYHLILQECRRLGGLVHNVLDYARIEQKRKEYSFENGDVTALVRHTVDLMQPTATERAIELVLEDCPVDAEIDREALEQALINLIDNAIKFSPPESQVTVRLTRSETEFIMSVADSGPGVPPTERERVFEHFFRGEDELRRETKGVGIGLSIVRHVIEAHAGKVRVSDHQPTGAIFTLTIPKKQP